MSVLTEQRGQILVVTIDRPDRRNAVDRDAARLLYEAFRSFDEDAGCAVAVLTGAGGTFCAGADLFGLAAGRPNEVELPARVVGSMAPMGPTRLALGKPVVAAIEGHAVAGGLELALWCDLRVAARDAVLGVFSRRFGVPLIDGGTVRLPRLVGHSRAMDLILTGRAVTAPEALAMGLVNRVCAPGGALEHALRLAEQVASFPAACLRADRASALAAWSLPLERALAEETAGGLAVLASGEPMAGARDFAEGAGRHGAAR